MGTKRKGVDHDEEEMSETRVKIQAMEVEDDEAREGAK
jgi:hypothetical protein